MKIYKKMRREVNISIWWKFIAYEILHVCLVYSYALMKYNTFHRNNYYTVEYDTITHAFISACIELSSCAIFDITLLIVCINKSKKNISIAKYIINEMEPDEYSKFEEDWKNADKYKYHGNIFMILSGYIAIRKKGLSISWAIIPIKQIRQISLSEQRMGKNKIIIRFINVSKIINGAAPEIWDSIVTGSYSTMVAEEIVERINIQMTKVLEGKAFHLSSKVFDDEGGYGGNQNVNSDMSEDIRSAAKAMISQKYHRELISDEEFDIFLKRLGSEGCGYVALINTICVHFENREQEFLQKFGYPLYAENGDFNFDYLLLDLYSSMDNYDPNTHQRNYQMDYKEKDDGSKDIYNFWQDTTGKGTTVGERKYYIEHFLGAHNIKVLHRNYANVTLTNFEKLTKQGWQIIVSLHNGKIYRNGYEEFVERHAMQVTGVTDDGKFIVSSWGKQYCFDPKENEYLYFSMLRYFS